METGAGAGRDGSSVWEYLDLGKLEARLESFKLLFNVSSGNIFLMAQCNILAVGTCIFNGFCVSRAH